MNVKSEMDEPDHTPADQSTPVPIKKEALDIKPISSVVSWVAGETQKQEKKRKKKGKGVEKGEGKKMKREKMEMGEGGNIGTFATTTGLTTNLDVKEGDSKTTLSVKSEMDEYHTPADQSPPVPIKKEALDMEPISSVTSWVAGGTQKQGKKRKKKRNKRKKGKRKKMKKEEMGAPIDIKDQSTPVPIKKEALDMKAISSVASWVAEETQKQGKKRKKKGKGVEKGKGKKMKREKMEMGAGGKIGTFAATTGLTTHLQYMIDIKVKPEPSASKLPAHGPDLPSVKLQSGGPLPKLEEEEEEEEEIEEREGETPAEREERIQNKRAQQMQTRIRNCLTKMPILAFSDLVRNYNRKQVASKFYTLLVLKKRQAVDVQQVRISDKRDIIISQRYN